MLFFIIKNKYCFKLNKPFLLGWNIYKHIKYKNKNKLTNSTQLANDKCSLSFKFVKALSHKLFNSRPKRVKIESLLDSKKIKD